MRKQELRHNFNSEFWRLIEDWCKAKREYYLEKLENVEAFEEFKEAQGYDKAYKEIMSLPEILLANIDEEEEEEEIEGDYDA